MLTISDSGCCVYCGDSHYAGRILVGYRAYLWLLAGLMIDPSFTISSTPSLRPRLGGWASQLALLPYHQCPLPHNADILYRLGEANLRMRFLRHNSGILLGIGVLAPCYFPP